MGWTEEHGVERRLVSSDGRELPDPTRRLRLGRPGTSAKHGVRPFTRDDEERLLVHLRDSRPEVCRFVLVGFRAGLRIGEIIGLHVDDINLERGLIYARRTVSQTRQQVHAPKTAGSERKVYLAVSSLPWR